MKIAIACDHESFQLKEALIPYLKKLGHTVRDFGSHSPRPCDYPDYALEAAQAVSSDDCDKGIVLCATGVGVSITANKVKGIRCALANDVNTAKASRQYEDANMLALGATLLDTETAFEVVKTWLATPFSNEDDHQTRIDKIMDYEKKQEKEKKRQEKELARLRKHKCKKRRTPYRPRHFGILNSMINGALCTLLVIALTLLPLTTFLTKISDPQAAMDALINSNILSDLMGQFAGDSGSTTPETTEPETAEPENDETPAPAVAGTGYARRGYTAKLASETPAVPGVGDLGGLDPSTLDTSALLGNIQGLIDAGIIDEETLKESLGEDVEIDKEGLGADLMESELAKELVSEYVGSVMDSAMNPDAESTFTEEKVKEIMNKHMDELTEIVNNNISGDAEISQEVLQSAVSSAVDVALPSVMESLPDTSETARQLMGEGTAFGKVLKVLKFINSGALRAIVLLVIVVLCIVIAVFRLPGLHGLTTIGIGAIVAGISCCGTYLVFDTPMIASFLGSIDLVGAIISPVIGTLAQTYYVSAIVFSFLGICLVVGTTVLRGVFGRLFHAIFAD